jgi:uncharacterized 2Fe-2S/4Fe-4S cluster protein (DUF4445 family)
MKPDDTIIFQPSGKRIECNGKKSLLELARAAGVGIESACGGKGKCGKCKVHVRGEVAPPTESELTLLAGAETDGFRLACRTQAMETLTVWVPEESRLHRQVILTGGEGSAVDLSTSLKVFQVEVPSVVQGHLTGDRERILTALSKAAGKDGHTCWTTPHSVLQDMVRVIDSRETRLNAVVRLPDTVVSIDRAHEQPLLGLAVDLGTTTIVTYLLDLRSGKTLSIQAAVNPQISHGEDVISRITFCTQQTDETSLLSGLARECINSLVSRACNEAGVEQKRIFLAVIVGNTTMMHLLMGIEPVRLGKAPFSPVAMCALEFAAKDLGLHLASEAVVAHLPVKAGFFGSDAVAAALALDADKVREPTLIADLGTNGELILATPDGMLCCSTAAGPAFEGGHIQWGMRAAPGAVDDVQVSPSDLRSHVHVIGEQQPLGICGSGLVSLVSGLLDAEAIVPDGRFNQARAGQWLRKGTNGLEYVLAPKQCTGTGQDLVLSHKDVAELQLAKAAVYAGVSILMDEAGVKNLSRVLLAGAFGNYLNEVHACRIGMFPGVAGTAVRGVGNAAGAGAVKVLLNQSQRERAERIAANMKYFDLARDRRFSSIFAGGLRFS